MLRINTRKLGKHCSVLNHLEMSGNFQTCGSITHSSLPRLNFIRPFNAELLLLTGLCRCYEGIMGFCPHINKPLNHCRLSLEHNRRKDSEKKRWWKRQEESTREAKKKRDRKWKSSWRKQTARVWKCNYFNLQPDIPEIIYNTWKQLVNL